MFIVSVLVVALLLAISELSWRNTKVQDETSRKFVHVTVGSFVAIWPFFLSWTEIRLLSLMFLLVVALSKYLHLLKAIHSVQRPTWGELFFALAVGLTTFITHNKWVYMTALLQMSLADGLAAVAGVKYGKESRYKILGHTKSVVGSLVCLATSLILLIIYRQASDATIASGNLLGLATGVTLLENVGIRGLDNLIIPLLIAFALTKL